MLRVIIPSKDRPAQLDLLLRSIKRFSLDWSDNSIFILYRTTTDEFAAGYKKLMEEHPQFVYCEEDSFRKD